ITLSEKAFSGNFIRLNGVYDDFPREESESALQAIDFTNLELITMEPDELGKERADFLKGQLLSEIEVSELENWEQTLNIRKGWFRTAFTFNGLHLEHEVYALRHMLHTGIVKITVTAEKDKAFTLKNRMSIDDTYKYQSSKYLSQLRERKIPLFTVSAKSPGGRHTLATTSSFFFEGDEKPEISYVDEGLEQPFIKFSKQMEKGESFTFYLIGSMCTTHLYSDPVWQSSRLNIYSWLQDPAKLIHQHKQTWDDFWKETNVYIEDQPAIERDMRMAIFMLNSFVNEDTEFSTACMGLGRDYWNWKVLWDADFWMYPAILLTNPDAARSMLEYRYNRLDMAKHNAAAHGFEGAMFPWESASSGEGTTSLMYLTGPFQHHISSDVGLAFWRYYCVTQDKEWLKNRGYPVLKAVADFWVSRAEKNEQGQYEIKNVVGSDEFAINVDNDAFTNGSAIQVLKAAHKASGILGKEGDPDWKEVADKLVLRRFPDGTVKEYDTYNGQTIKQADVNLISFPLDVITDRETVRKNLNYYENKITEHGPNMSFAMFAGAAARAGYREETTRLFEKALLPYRKGPFNILSLRTQGTSTYFGTSAGGLLQAFILGFGGLHFTEDGLVQKDPLLPEGWGSITYKGIGDDQDFEVEEK
ncbi:MAG: glycosyl hydrolase family 95 catalytic domain-containing protein, partial [Bacteroidota bacterium]